MNLAEIVALACEHAPATRRRFETAGINPEAVRSVADLAGLPVLHKEQLVTAQQSCVPFGGLLGARVADLARIFMSPGPIYDPQGAGPDHWRFGRALQAAGFGPGDLAVNCFSYHLSPAGFMFDEAARACGAGVVPAGIGQQDLQIRLMQDLPVTAYIGLPSYLAALLEKAGGPLGLRKAMLAAEMLPESLRRRFEAMGIATYQCYGTADLGLIAYECISRAGLHVDESVIVEILDPVTGAPLPAGEVGEVVVTVLSETYPLIRFGTGDLAGLMAEPCGCGMKGPRLKGILGRAGEAVKVRGMFVHPGQIAQAVARFPGVERWRAEVTRGGHLDRLTVVLQAGPELDLDLAAVAEAVRESTRLRAEVVRGEVAEGARRLEDKRTWD
jgi:phenylacetate-CoA ligase